MKTFEKLTLEHLAPYLPYGLKFSHFDDEREIKSICEFAAITSEEITITNSMHEYSMLIEDCNPNLRPLSDLHKPIQDNGNWTIPANYLYRQFDVTDMEFNGNIIDPKHGYDVYVFLISHHFDVFNLIEQGLAIDINTLTP